MFGLELQQQHGTRHGGTSQHTKVCHTPLGRSATSSLTRPMRWENNSLFDHILKIQFSDPNQPAFLSQAKGLSVKA